MFKKKGNPLLLASTLCEIVYKASNDFITDERIYKTLLLGEDKTTYYIEIITMYTYAINRAIQESGLKPINEQKVTKMFVDLVGNTYANNDEEYEEFLQIYSYRIPEYSDITNEDMGMIEVEALSRAFLSNVLEPDRYIGIISITLMRSLYMSCFKSGEYILNETLKRFKF